MRFFLPGGHFHYMPRQPRTIAVGLPHHVTHRGNCRRDIFLNDALRLTYLRFLREQSRDHQLDVLAYCLMTNHLHLVVIPRTETALPSAMRSIHGRFAHAWNSSCNGSGHMWENRYFSCPMQPQRVWAVVRYVELNPVRAGIVANALDYPWSSASAHTTGLDPTGILNLPWWHDTWGNGNWAEALLSDGPGSDADAIRRSTYSGHPFGDSAFVSGLEHDCGRSLLPQRRGRPRKATHMESIAHATA